MNSLFNCSCRNLSAQEACQELCGLLHRCWLCIHTAPNHQFLLLVDCKINWWFHLKPWVCAHLPFPLAVPRLSERGIFTSTSPALLNSHRAPDLPAGTDGCAGEPQGADCEAHGCRKLCVYSYTVSLKLNLQLDWLLLPTNTQEKLIAYC